MAHFALGILTGFAISLVPSLMPLSNVLARLLALCLWHLRPTSSRPRQQTGLAPVPRPQYPYIVRHLNRCYELSSHITNGPQR